MESNPLTGEVISESNISLKDADTGFSNYLPYYISAAYDSSDDTLWGYTCSRDGSGYSFFTAKADDVQGTQAVVEKEVWERVCASVCYNEKEKALYGINRENNFVRIEKDGSQTVVMPLGVRTEYATTALFYDEVDDCYYWYAQLLDANSGIYSIDPKANSLTLVMDYSERLQFPFLAEVQSKDDPAPISKPIIDKADFGKGGNSGTISIFMPQTMFSGEAVTGEMTWHAYVDGVETASGKAEAGARVNVQYTDLADGDHTFAFDVDQNGVKSARISKQYFIGYDVPPMPENVKITESTVTWSPIFRGDNGGYLDHKNMVYHIYINGEESGQVVNDTTYNWPADKSALFAGYAATVVAENHGKFSKESEVSNTVRFGEPWPLDFQVTPTQNEARAFTLFDLDGDKDGWKFNMMFGETPCFRESLNFSGSDDWLFSPPIKFEETDPFYEVSFDISNFAVNYPGLDAQVYLCKAMSTEKDSIVTTIYDAAPAADRMWHPIKKLIGIPEPGVYYLAIHCYRKDRSVGNGLRFKEINVKNTHITAPLPSQVTNMKAWGGKKGELTAEIQFEMPTTYLNGKEIPDDVEIEVIVKAQNEVKVSGHKGETKNVFVTTTQGINEVFATPVIGEYEGQVNSVRVYCGYDIPGPATNVSAYTSEDNLSLHIKWDRPSEKGSRGYYVDPEKVEYAIMRNTEEGWVEYDRVGSDVFEYTFTVDGDKGLKSEWIGIAPSNEAGTADEFAWMSDMLGAPIKLPAVETFHGGSPDLKPIRTIRTNDPERMTDWGFVEPSKVVGDCPYAIALQGSTLQAPAGGMLMLPKFSTEGLKDVGMSINVWTGNNMAKMAIYGDTYNYTQPVVLQEIPSGKGWQNICFRLPEDLQDKQWITLYIGVDYKSTKQFAMVTGYEVKDGYLVGVESIGNEASYIMGGESIQVIGHEGENVKVYAPDGRLVKEVVSAPNALEISVAPGIYVVVTDSASAKVITK